MSKYPVNAADFTSFILVIIGIIFIYVGTTYEQSGYTALGIIEFLLAIIQSYINRLDLTFSTRF